MTTSLKPSSGNLSPAQQNFLTLLLSVAGGAVDAAMLLRFHVLTAAQTGNTILLAVAFGEHRLATGFYSGISVIGYIFGSVLGELIMLRSENCRRSPAAWGLLAELVPLAALLMCWHFAHPRPDPDLIAVLVALSATAMGMQSAAVLRIHAGPTTTYVTGTLTTFATLSAQRMYKKRASANFSSRQGMNGGVLSRVRPAIYGLDWVIYLSGAVAGAFLSLRIREWALVLPLGAVIVATVAAFWCAKDDRTP